jgi:hypothetical protein
VWELQDGPRVVHASFCRHVTTPTNTRRGRCQDLPLSHSLQDSLPTWQHRSRRSSTRNSESKGVRRFVAGYNFEAGTMSPSRANQGGCRIGFDSAPRSRLNGLFIYYSEAVREQRLVCSRLGPRKTCPSSTCPLSRRIPTYCAESHQVRRVWFAPPTSFMRQTWPRPKKDIDPSFLGKDPGNTMRRDGRPPRGVCYALL